MTSEAPKTAKYLFVTGGVVSSLGKGIVAASLAKLLQCRGYRVTIQKFDPYLNVDPGTLNPYEHGEVFVTEDGAETDLDLGHYERFLNQNTSQANNITTGAVYQTVIQRERLGEYGGKTVQVIPNVTDEIKRRMRELGESGQYDIIISEIGGTVGDIESLPYIEAARQLDYELGSHDVAFIHLTLIPYLRAAGELKTKPTQHSVKQLLQSGVQPDILVCRTEEVLSRDLRQKIALFCNLNVNAVIEARDAGSIYEVPLLMKREQLDRVALSKLKLPLRQEPDLESWMAFLHRLRAPEDQVEIGLVGKYVELPDAYKSIQEALIHAATQQHLQVNIRLIHSEDLNADNLTRKLGKLQGLIVAPGFGERGYEGKLLAVRHARQNGLPFFGICLGMQMAVVEFSRNVAGLEDAQSTEFDPDTATPVISLMESQKDVEMLGGTMRLGVYDCDLERGSLAHKLFKRTHIRQRHRHRFEFNHAYRPQLEAAGLRMSGINPETGLVEIIELPEHPFFLGCQFHPEYASRPEAPHPLFLGFMKAAYAYKDSSEAVADPVN